MKEKCIEGEQTFKKKMLTLGIQIFITFKLYSLPAVISNVHIKMHVCVPS